MMQHLTSKRLGRRAYFRSLLIVGLIAGGSYAPLASLSAQSPSQLPLADSAPPSLASIAGIGAGLPDVDASCHTLAAMPMLLPTEAGVPAPSPAVSHSEPKRVVRMLGLKQSRTEAVAQFSPLAMPTQFDAPPVPQINAVMQVQYEAPLTTPPKTPNQASMPAGQTTPVATAGVVAHAYLAESNTSSLRGSGRAILRPLSADSVPNGKTAASSLPADTAPSDDAPVIGAPVPYDAASSAAASDIATAQPLEESESLLDLDLSSLTAQGPKGTPQGSAGNPSAPAAVSIVEEAPMKLIGTEPGPLGAGKPITRAPRLTLSDADSTEQAPKSAPVRAQVASQLSSPSRVTVHESFAPRPSSGGQAFHLSDDEAPEQRVVARPAKLSRENALASDRKPNQESKPAVERKPVTEPVLAQELKVAAAVRPVAALPETQPAPALTLASPPALLPPSSALLEMSESSAATAEPSASVTLAAPFVPGTDGMVVKASRPGLEQPESRPAAAQQPPKQVAAASKLESRAPQLAGSSSHRPVSLRVGGSAASAPSTPTLDSEQRALKDNNPIAMTGPVVRAVKQPVNPEKPVVTPEPVTKPAETPAPATQPTDAPETSPQSQMVRDLMNTIKKSFPNSRVELKSDEEGLVAEGVAASESEAKKILAMVRTTALCPVVDHIITKR